MPGSPGPLADYLEKRIKTELTQLATMAGGQDKVVGVIANGLFDPFDSPYDLMNRATARLDRVSDELKKRRAEAPPRVRNWVIPRFAALAFESLFESCVAYWIAKGPPDPPAGGGPPPDFREDVEKFIKSQVKLFAAAIET